MERNFLSLVILSLEKFLTVSEPIGYLEERDRACFAWGSFSRLLESKDY